MPPCVERLLVLAIILLLSPLLGNAARVERGVAQDREEVQEADVGVHFRNQSKSAWSQGHRCYGGKIDGDVAAVRGDIGCSDVAVRLHRAARIADGAGPAGSVAD